MASPAFIEITVRPHALPSDSWAPLLTQRALAQRLNSSPNYLLPNLALNHSDSFKRRKSALEADTSAATNQSASSPRTGLMPFAGCGPKMETLPQCLPPTSSLACIGDRVANP